MKLLNINDDKLARTSLSQLNIDYANAILIHNDTANIIVSYRENK